MSIVHGLWNLVLFSMKSVSVWNRDTTYWQLPILLNQLGFFSKYVLYSYLGHCHRAWSKTLQFNQYLSIQINILSAVLSTFQPTHASLPLKKSIQCFKSSQFERYLKFSFTQTPFISQQRESETVLYFGCNLYLFETDLFEMNWQFCIYLKFSLWRNIRYIKLYWLCDIVSSFWDCFWFWIFLILPHIKEFGNCS